MPRAWHAPIRFMRSGMNRHSGLRYSLSFPRKRESRTGARQSWIPAFAGMTTHIALALVCCTSAFSASSALADDCAAPKLENTVPMEAIGDSGEVAVFINLTGATKKFLFDTGGGTMNYMPPAEA